jgi:hypothetical protein
MPGAPAATRGPGFAGSPASARVTRQQTAADRPRSNTSPPPARSRRIPGRCLLRAGPWDRSRALPPPPLVSRSSRKTRREARAASPIRCCRHQVNASARTHVGRQPSRGITWRNIIASHARDLHALSALPQGSGPEDQENRRDLASTPPSRASPDPRDRARRPEPLARWRRRAAQGVSPGPPRGRIVLPIRTLPAPTVAPTGHRPMTTRGDAGGEHARDRPDGARGAGGEDRGNTPPGLLGLATFSPRVAAE